MYAEDDVINNRNEVEDITLRAANRWHNLGCFFAEAGAAEIYSRIASVARGISRRG